MKALNEIYGLFVDDPLLAVAGLVALAAGGLAAKMGLAAVSGLIVLIIVGIGLTVSVRRG